VQSDSDVNMMNLAGILMAVLWVPPSRSTEFKLHFNKKDIMYVTVLFSVKLSA